MKKIFFGLCIKSFVFFLVFNIWQVKAVDHFTESFSGGPSVYYTGTHTFSSGLTWDLASIKGESASNSVGGIGGAARFLISTTAYIISPSVNTLETITFQYRELNAVGGGTFKVQKSVGGGSFVDIATQNFSGNTYQTFTLNVNDNNSNIRIKIVGINNSSYLIVDELILTAISTDPALTLSANSLTGFSYIVGSGPSTSQSYNLSGSNLTGAPDNIIITAPTDYEVSLNNSTFSASVNMAYTSATLSSTPVYVRLISGLSVNSYDSEIITNAGGGATTVNVTCNGTVTTPPPSTLTANPTSLSGFTYIVGNGPSTSQSYNLSGSNLTGAPDNIIITAPTDYEVSLNNSTFSASVNLAFTSAILSSTPVYVRLISGLSVNSYNSEIITNAGGGATTVNVTCNGTVTTPPPPTLTANPTSLSGFTYIVGNGPSTSQSYNLSGSNLTGAPDNIIITAPTDYEVSLNNSTFSASVNVAYASATLASTPVYVRLISGLPVNAYNSEIITNAGGGATTVNITCSGSVTAVSSTCINEGFANGTTAPIDWIFTSIGGTYVSAGNFGAAPPSLKFDATGDMVETPAFSSATELSFWIKGQTATGSYLLVEGFSGSSWTQVDNILLTSITTGTTKTYNSGSTPALVSGFTKFRFTYTKAVSNLSFDDVVVTCDSTVASPDLNISENINVQVFPNPNKGSFEVSILGDEQFISSIYIVNVLGQIVYKNEMDLSLNTKLIIQVQLNAGIYFLKASVNGSIVTKKILID